MVVEKREGRETYTQAAHTRCVVELHSDSNPGGDVIVLDATEDSDTAYGHLVSVKTSKRLDACSGTFTIVVKKPQELYSRQESMLRLWRDPEDVWVRIYFVVDGQRIHTMTGLIDSINESMVRDANGKRVETYTIEGRDFGKVFETMQLWVNLPNTGLDAPASLARYMNTAMPKNPNVGTPSAWVKWWLEGWVANGGLAEVQWQLPRSLGGGSFYDALNLDNIQPMDEGNGLLADGTGYEPDLENGFGKLWDKMVEYSNEVMNELWVDLDTEESENRKMSLYLRERPFITHLSGNSKWVAVKQHVLEPYDVFQRSMSKGGSAGRFNYWMLSLDGRLVPADERALVMNGRIDSAHNGEPGGVPIWNQESIVRHGVRRWEQSTMFLSGLIAAGNPAENVWPKVLANWLRKCHDWYVTTPMQLSGTITTTRLLPEIRVGQRLKEKRSEGAVEYYIEGVDNSWAYPNAGRTQVMCTFGAYEDDHLLDYVYHQIKNPQSLRLKECGDFSTDVEGTVDFLTQGCRFEPHGSGGGPPTLLLTHGGEGFEVTGSPTTPDNSGLEEVGKSLLEEGAPDVSKAQPNPTMIPTQDIENDQARALARGDANASITKPSGTSFGKAQLQRNEDPLSGFDEAESSDDPIYGLTE